MRKSLLVLVLCGASSFAALASANPWVGTWTLDPSRSHFIGTTFTYSQSADGTYHYSDGPKGTETDFRIDSREYKTEGTSTFTWTASGDNAWDTVHKTNGIVVERIDRQLSSDGKTFNMTAEGTQPDGVKYHDSYVYRRLTTGKGLLGKWVSTKVDSSVPDTVVILPSPSGVYRWAAPAYKVAIEAKLDGSDTRVTGPLVSPGTTVTFRQITSNKIREDTEKITLSAPQAIIEVKLAPLRSPYIFAPPSSGFGTGGNGDSFSVSYDYATDLRTPTTDVQSNMTDTKPGWVSVLYGASNQETTTTLTTPNKGRLQRRQYLHWKTEATKSTYMV